MTIDEFFTQNNGKGIDFDGYYGNQCMDLAEAYNQNVIGAPRLGGNAVDTWTNYPKDFYDRIDNTPTGVPEKGDIVIWNVGKYGHIAVFSSGDVNSFISFDQNWPTQLDADGNGIGVCHFQPHVNYENVLGWLRPKNLPAPIETIAVPKSTFEDLVRKATAYDAVCDKEGFDKTSATGDMIISAVEKLRSDLSESQKSQAVVEDQNLTLTQQRDEAVSKVCPDPNAHLSNNSGGNAATIPALNNSPAGTSDNSSNSGSPDQTVTVSTNPIQTIIDALKKWLGIGK